MSQVLGSRPDVFRCELKISMVFSLFPVVATCSVFQLLDLVFVYFFYSFRFTVTFLLELV